MPKAPSVRWTREDALIALNLYGKLLFGQFHHTNPVMVDVAKVMECVGFTIFANRSVPLESAI
jgi:hypothetical protein